MQAAKKLGIERYIMLSSIFALQPDKWHIDGLDQILDYTIAKYFADNYLVNQSGLKYTILQPTNLTEEEGTDKISLDVTGVTSNPIPDVAKTLAEILKHDNTIGKVIMMKSGDTPIDAALASVK
jgi:nucleoside-diphosphate-sugar epimerase